LITYFALTALPYWPAANGPASSTQALFTEIVSLPLPLPSRRLRQEGSAIVLPVAFDHWLLRCIDREPVRRFASAREAVDALERALEGTDGVLAQAGLESEPVRLPTARSQLGLAATAAIQWAVSALRVASDGRSGPRTVRRILLLSVVAATLSLIMLGAWLVSR
jgi:hypothetical protein